MQFGTVHWRPENLQLGIQIVQNWLRKRPYALCESCRGSGDLQLCYSLLGPLLFNFLEFWSVKQGYLELLWTTGAPERAARRRAPGCALLPPQPPPWARHGCRGPTGSTRLAWGDWTARPPPSSPFRSCHASVVTAPTTQPGRRCTGAYVAVARAHAATPRPWHARHCPTTLGLGIKAVLGLSPFARARKNSRATPTPELPHCHSRPSC
jgi:hypothetical protein